MPLLTVLCMKTSHNQPCQPLPTKSFVFIWRHLKWWFGPFQGVTQFSWVSPMYKGGTVVQPLSHVQLFAIPWTVAHQAPLSMRFPRQEYWNGLSFHSPGDLPNPGIELASPVLQAGSLPLGQSGKPIYHKIIKLNLNNEE